MTRNKNKRNTEVKQKDTNKDDSFALQARQSSMKVNLSYVSNLSDSEHSSLKRLSSKNNKSTEEESLIHDDNIFKSFKKYHCKEISKVQCTLLGDIQEKEQQLNKSCMRLKDAIMNKTKVLFDNQNELAIKTTEVLSTGCTLSINEINGVNVKKSPSIKVNIGKNDQIVMSGDGKKRNPVQVNSMLNCSRNSGYISSETTNEENMFLNQSIVSTPKKSRTERHINGNQIYDKISPIVLKNPVTRLFSDNNNSNKSNMCRISNKLYCQSPILSQAIKKTKASRISLKNKFSQISSKSASSSIINQNLHDKNMFKKNKVDILNTNSLDDNTNNSETINISNDLNQSCMEITAIASQIPIISKSLKADNISNICNGIQNCNFLKQEEIPLTIKKNKNLNKKVNNLDLFQQIENESTSQNISLNINSIFDQMKSTDYIKQKENKIPNHTENKISKNNNKVLEENDSVRELSNMYSISSSMKLCTSLENIINIPNTINDDLDESHKIICLKSNVNIDQDKQNYDKIVSRQPSISTIRSSMQVNTSLDSIKKSPIIKTKLNFNNLLSMVQESYSQSNTNQSKIVMYTLKDEHLESDNDLENVPLIERISNISKIKTTTKENIESHNINSSTIKRSTKIINVDPNISTKSINKRNTNLISNDLSIIEATPYPISRSIQYKTMIKKNIAINTPNPQELIQTLSDNEYTNKFKRIIHKQKVTLKKNQTIYTRKKVSNFNSSDIHIQNASDEFFNEKERRKKLVINDESLNEMRDNIKFNKIFNIKPKNKKVTSKRKLYSLQENSGFISFTPTDITELSQEKESQHTVIKNRKITQKKQQNKLKYKSKDTINIRKSLENEIMLQKIEKRKRKNRKIISKKIIVKKVTNLTLLDNMMPNEEKVSQRLSDRNSLKEFDLKSIRCQRKENFYKNQKIIIVVTGLSKEERDLVRSAIKTLGSATLEINVTSRTTHVISSGVRTINMLKGIIRGCWLLSFEWALKSLENEQWLDPSPFEMIHFAKTVQENRRDRQLFGKAYVPELFVTCGMIYIESGTSPPTSSLKELIKIAGGRITEDLNQADIIIGLEGLREIWILDSITTGEVQSLEQYKRN